MTRSGLSSLDDLVPFISSTHVGPLRIFVSSWIPDTDEEGKPILGYIVEPQFSFNSLTNPIFSERVLLINKTTLLKFWDEFKVLGYETWLPGGIIVDFAQKDLYL